MTLRKSVCYDFCTIIGVFFGSFCHYVGLFGFCKSFTRRRQGVRETRKWGERETWRQGDRGTRTLYRQTLHRIDLLLNMSTMTATIHIEAYIDNLMTKLT